MKRGQWLVALVLGFTERLRRRRRTDAEGSECEGGAAAGRIVAAGTPERRAENVVLALLGVAILFALGFIVVYAEFSPAGLPNELLGICLGMSLVFVGAALTVVAKRLVVTEELEDDYPEASPEKQREIVEIVHESGSRFTRKRLLLGAGAATGGALGLAALAPVVSLGPIWDTAPLEQTPWRRGIRVVDEHGAPLRAADIDMRTFYTGFPEGADPENIGSPLVIIRLDPAKLRLPAGREDWTPHGILAFSKICTHAGCAIGLYRKPLDPALEPNNALVCPCHYSTFDPYTGASVIYGPAGRPLPQLPLLIDADGNLRAGGNLGPGRTWLVGSPGAGVLPSAMTDPVAEPVRFIDERTAASPLLRKAMRYLFPDHWSFLLGEVALYAFLVLIATGTYLALFYDPSTAKTVYHGSYTPLDGQVMSTAYKSVLALSLQDKAGLLMRQTHHWSADVFMVAIVMHLMRVFFTGAFRKPRELTWVIGLILLGTSLLEGFLGYSLVDDLLSGIGLAIGYGVGLSIPFVGGPLIQGVFGSTFPGKDLFFSRMYIAHVFIIPALLAVLIGTHLALIAARHHTQFKESRRTTEKRIVGVPMFPGQIPRSLALMFFTVGILFLLGGLVQINPIWQWGPFEPWQATNGAQPDWYLGWLIGALRLMPGFDVTIGHYTVIPNPFFGGVLFPLVVFGVLGAFPWLERRVSGDRRVHNLADRPRDAPTRTAFGVAFLAWVFLIFVFGAADRIFVLVGLAYNTQLFIFRVGIWVVPALLFFLARRVCRELLADERVAAVRAQAEHEAEAHDRPLTAARPPAG